MAPSRRPTTAANEDVNYFHCRGHVEGDVISEYSDHHKSNRIVKFNVAAAVTEANSDRLFVSCQSNFIAAA